MLEIIEPIENILIIKKSKFITKSHYITSLDEIKPIILATREEHPGANHVVHAAIIGEDGSSFSYSDDKEPRGSSGKPSFDVLKGSGLTNILITITRYFGGTLLGVGGLVSAYSSSVKALLEIQKSKELRKMKLLSFKSEYELSDSINYLIKEFNAIADINYLEKVYINLKIEDSKKDEFAKRILELSNGEIIL